MAKVGLISLGCSKNRVDSELMLAILRDAGHTLTADERKAEILIVNTCGFIDPAKQESIDTLLALAEYKETGCCKLLVATGCLVQRYEETLREEMPEIDRDITGDISFHCRPGGHDQGHLPQLLRGKDSATDSGSGLDPPL